LVALVASAAYAPSLGHGFIYDDYWTVVGNRHLDKPLGELLRAAASGRSVEWKMPDATRPTLGLSLWLDRQLFGLSAAGHHLQSVFLYALVSVLAFWLAFALLRSFAAALAAGLAFAVMPLHSEVVSAVNYREDLLAAVAIFAALALCFWPAPRAEKGWPYATAALWFYALASKESALCAPLLVAALTLVRRIARWTWQGPLALAGVAVLALWLNWRFGLSVLGEQIPRADYGSWLERGLRTARFELWSLWNSLLPLRAQPEYDPLSDPSWLWAAAVMPLVALLVALAWRRRTRPALGVLGVALLAPLVTSPLLAPTNEIADRYCFVGSLAAALVVGWGFRKLARAQSLVALLLLASMTAVGVRECWSATSVWHSEVSLWTFAAQSAPHSPRSWASLSRVHRMADQADLAERAIQRSLALKPEFAPALVARALNLLWEGDRSSARRVLAAVVPKSDLHRDALNVASHCAFLPTDAAAQECARRAVPKGMVLGDPDVLRVVSERLLAQ
jgi:protein O-mannosyl-transferase